MQLRYQARGPRFESRREHSSSSLKSADFVPVAPRVAFSGMGQARVENNLFILYQASRRIQLNPGTVVVLNKHHLVLDLYSLLTVLKRM